MKVIDIYGHDGCLYCVKAKRLVEGRGYRHFYLDTTAPVLKRQLKSRFPEVQSIPQVFIGDLRIGGFTELEQADADGTLAKLMKG